MEVNFTRVSLFILLVWLVCLRVDCQVDTMSETDWDDTTPEKRRWFNSINIG